MSTETDYTPPSVWTWDTAKDTTSRFANINRPIAGATHEKDLPVGKHPLHLHAIRRRIAIQLHHIGARGRPACRNGMGAYGGLDIHQVIL